MPFPLETLIYVFLVIWVKRMPICFTIDIFLECDLLMQAGWKLWPFAHLVTYGVIPVEQRLLWVDCVELIWVTILST